MKRKILSVFMVLVLAIGCIFSLTACGNANEDYQELVKAAAKDYYAKHDDYKNFDDITIEYTGSTSESRESAAEGKMDSEKTEASQKVAVKKVGSEYVLVSESNAKIDETVWQLKEDSETEYEEVKSTTVSSRKVVFGTKTENSVTIYFAVQETSVKVDDEEAIEAKTYMLFISKEAYVASVESVMREISGVMNSFYRTGNKSALIELELEGAEVELEVKKEDATLKASISDYSVSSYSGYTDSTMEETITFVGGKASALSMSMNMTGAKMSNVMAQGATIAYSADVPTISSFDGYTLGSVGLNGLVPDLDF